MNNTPPLGGSRARPSAPLMSAALAGLLGAAVPSCTSQETGAPPSDKTDCPPAVDGGTSDSGVQDAGMTPTAPIVTGTSKDEKMTFSKFVDACTKRGGFVQTHAACAGNNACRGVSYNKHDHVLTEHTCKAMNTCGGMSCVELPADQGRTGKAIFDSVGCNHCHGGDKFPIWAPVGTPEAEALARFKNRSTTLQARIVAFGLQGLSPGGISYTNMPPFHEKVSRAEALRVVEYIRTLPTTVEYYDVLTEADEALSP